MGNIDIVNLLLKSNSFVDNETKDGYSSLHIAAKEGHEEIASLLIDHGANLNLFTKVKFYFSIKNICFHIFLFLLEKFFSTTHL